MIERVRTVEKARAARVSAEAEALSARLGGVAEKTRALASHYGAMKGIETADDLRRTTAMRQQLLALDTLNNSHFADARRRADLALTELGSAERKRSRIEHDRRSLERVILAKSNRS